MYHRGNGGSEQSEALKQDALISALKKDLYDLRDKEHNFVTMSDEVNKYEARLEMQKEEK